MSHPQVTVCIFLENSHLTKAFSPKKVRDWTSKPLRNVIAAVTDFPESHTTFSVSDKVLGSDNTYLVDSPQVHYDVRTILVSNFLKDHKKKLSHLPSWFDSELKRVKLVVFPAVLSFLKLNLSWKALSQTRQSKPHFVTTMSFSRTGLP